MKNKRKKPAPLFAGPIELTDAVVVDRAAGSGRVYLAPAVWANPDVEIPSRDKPRK